MSIEEKQNFQTYQDSNSVEYPKSEKEVSSLIKQYYKSNVPIELVGLGSKSKIGKAMQCGKTINFSQMSGIIEYLPEELYIKVKPCTPIQEIEEKLKKNKQHLAFEPVDFGYIFEGKSNFGSAAGHVACNFSGPRRFKTGSLRDHLLGFRGVNGKGEIIKSGGVVVKNVTGYDLSKLVSGSYGTLVALTEITFKVLPLSEENKTLVFHKLELEQSINLLNQAINSSNDVSGAAFLPNGTENKGCIMNVNQTFKLNDLKYGGSLTAIRIEGSRGSIDEKMQNLIKELKINNFDISTLETVQSTIFWNKVKNLEVFTSTKNNIFKIVIPPSNCIQVLYQLSSKKFKYYVDWGGALIWVEAHELTEEKFDSLRKKVVRLNGYISMIKFSDYLPLVEEVFTTNKDRFFISQSIKKSFDPKRILNPGKMYTGI